jgi:butyrate kinase
MRLLVINPGSTSTKIAVFNDLTVELVENLEHKREELSQYPTIAEQFVLRKQAIDSFLMKHEINNLQAVIGRGGLLHPLASGTYLIDEYMVDELLNYPTGQHASNLGAIIAFHLANQLNIPAFTADPVVVDEFSELARISGVKSLPRISVFHALNQKAVAKRWCTQFGRDYEQVNLIVAHLGGGITIGVHHCGKVVDVNNPLQGEGPFSSDRSGSVPVSSLLDYAQANGIAEARKLLVGQGGLLSLVGTNSVRDLIRDYDHNSEYKLAIDALIYQVAKEIGAMASVVDGKVDQIILTGGIANSGLINNKIERKVGFIAPITVYGGEDEMLALAEAGYKALQDTSSIKRYRRINDEKI